MSNRGEREDRSEKREAYRARIIESILSKRTRTGGKVGIYGAQVCQLCGHVDTFRGWAGAMLSHFPWQGRSFVCRGCRARHIPRSETAISARDKAVTRALDGQADRYCELCGTTVAKDGSEMRRFWLCERCRDGLSAHFSEEEFGEVVKDFTRRRYLEIECASEDQLRAWDMEMERFRRALEPRGP